MPVFNPHYTYNPLKTTAYCTWARPSAAILENGRQTQVYHRTSGRQADSGRWAPGLSSAHCLPSPPHVCSRVYSQLTVYMFDFWLDNCNSYVCVFGSARVLFSLHFIFVLVCSVCFRNYLTKFNANIYTFIYIADEVILIITYRTACSTHTPPLRFGLQTGCWCWAADADIVGLQIYIKVIQYSYSQSNKHLQSASTMSVMRSSREQQW